jgi:hypothetical protein
MINRAELKTKLVELRFWRANEIGDPTINYEDAQRVRIRIQHKLAKDTFFNPGFHIANPISTEIVRFVGDKKIAYDLATGDDFQLAICASAIQLPRFLTQHPECAANSGAGLYLVAGSGAF